MNRRHFLKAAVVGTAGAALAPSISLAADERRLVILHTNDTHSRIDPFPMDGGRNQGLGGVARRARLINGIRKRHDNVLLLDSGDIFQGTPYFNLFDGEIDFKAMSKMRYDIATLGNHDFDNGVEGLMDVIEYADFQFVSSNYRTEGTPLSPYVSPYSVRNVGDLRIGVFGLGIAFEGLVLPSLHEGVTYEDPYGVSREMVQELKYQGCHLIIALSHLGHSYRDSERPSETLVAREVPGVDLILGGHTHTFLDHPEAIEHEDGSQTIVNQVGWAGIRLGRIDVVFDRRGNVVDTFSASIPVDARWDVA